jgi:hypothetical protein
LMRALLGLPPFAARRRCKLGLILKAWREALSVAAAVLIELLLLLLLRLKRPWPWDWTRRGDIWLPEVRRHERVWVGHPRHRGRLSCLWRAGRSRPCSRCQNGGRKTMNHWCLVPCHPCLPSESVRLDVPAAWGLPKEMVAEEVLAAVRCWQLDPDLQDPPPLCC